MALSLREAIRSYDDDEPTELVGIPLDRRRRAGPIGLEVDTEIAHLKETIAAKDAHIASLETMVWAWRSQAASEVRQRKAERAEAFDRERDLVRIIHRQLLQLEDSEVTVRRRGWLRRR